MLFLPHEHPTSGATAFGVGWQDWDVALRSESADEDPTSETAAVVGFGVSNWRRDDDLLATDADGQVLAVEQLRCQRRRKMDAPNATTLASFADRVPLLVRAATKRGGAYFLSTLPTADCSNFVDDGIVLFVMMHRCLDAGAIAAGEARQLVAGEVTG